MTRKANRINLQFVLCMVLALTIALSLSLAGCKSGKDVNPSVSPSASSSASADADNGIVIKNGDFESASKNDKDGKAFQSTIEEFSKSADGGIANNKANGSSTVGVVDVKSESFATDTDLADAENPGLYSEDVEGSHVMMIFNRTANAYLAKSGKVTLAAKTYAKITVWVYTHNLQSYVQANYSDKDNLPTDDTFGAHITVSDRTNSASNKIATSFDDIVIRDINTNSTWKQYTVYVASGDFASTTFYVSLGLGNGTQSMKEDYVKGLAFFDDLKLEYISAAEYAENAATANLANGKLTGDKQVISDEDPNATGKATAINFKLTAESDLLTSMTNIVPTQNGDVVAPQDTTGIKGLLSLEEAKAVDSEAFANFPFAANSQILMIQNAIATSYQVTGGDITLPANSYKAVTVYVKTSAINSGIGANITIITKGANGVSNPADYVYTTTSNINTAATDHSEDKNYFWDNWDAYTLLLKNGSSKELTVAIRLSLGATDVATVSPFNYTQGWAAFTNGSIINWE
ncbi:MAG: hypothetical protein IIW27_01955 [Clostridia bacterium]|nr:hypothetical protein [Clostridia bacterium]